MLTSNLFDVFREKAETVGFECKNWVYKKEIDKNRLICRKNLRNSGLNINELRAKSGDRQITFHSVFTTSLFCTPEDQCAFAFSEPDFSTVYPDGTSNSYNKGGVNEELVVDVTRGDKGEMTSFFFKRGLKNT